MPKPTRRIEGFQRAHWLRWGQLLGAPRAGEPRGGLLVVTAPESGARRVVQLVHTERGLLEVSSPDSGRASERFEDDSVLEDLARREDAAWAFALDEAALVALRSFLAPGGPRSDYLESVLELWDTLVAMQHGGALKSFPHPLDSWPFLAEVLPYGLDAALGEGQSAVVAIWRGGELHTALAVRRRHGKMDVMLGPDALVPSMGLVSGDFRRDYRYLSEAVARELGPLAFGFFGHYGAVRELLRRESPRAWAEAIAARDVIISPMSAAVALPVGVDVGRTFLRGARSFLGDLGLGSFIPSELSVLLEPTVTRPDVRDLMGFDPFELVQLVAAPESSADLRKRAVPQAALGG